MYFVIDRATKAPTAGRALATHRPGWIARRRARGGISHRRGRVGLGYRRALFGAVHLTLAELAGHGLAVGGPKSGKTTLLRLLIEACVGRLPIIVIDPKGSAELADTVRAHGGVVWTIDGKTPADLLDPRPWQVPEQLLEAEDYSPEARAYRDAAHQRALWAAWSLALDGKPMDLAELRRRLDRAILTEALKRHHGRDPRVTEWLHHLEHQHGGIEDSGARGLDRTLGILLDGPALRGSLRTCPEALRLEDVLDTRGLVLFSLDELTYPHATRKIAAWVLLAMGRLARTLPAAGEDGAPRALLLADEIGSLRSAARHLRPLVGRAREAGLSVVMATQGLTDLEAVDRALVHQVLQDTAWQLGFRQGSRRDAELMQGLFGEEWIEDVTRWSDGRSSSRQVERSRVSIHEWMNGLQPGDGWLRRAPIDRPWGQDRVRVALPRRRSTGSVNTSVKGSVIYVHEIRTALTESRGDERADTSGVPGIGRGGPGVLPPVPPDCPPEMLAKVGADVLAKVERRWPRKHHELGPCLVWTGARGPDAERGPYGRVYDPAIGRTDYVHLVVWRRCYPDRPIPKGWTADHLCEVGLCARPDHLDQRPVTRADNTRRRHQRSHEAAPAPNADTFAIALFAGVDQPAVQPRTLSLDELADMLGRFEVLANKRRGRCWSPTRYADGATSRNNAGVHSVSCLVFDCDRVPPDPDRLTGVCWIGHTTYQHTPDKPRWRVVIPLARPVAAKRWANVWQRARAALCPEADPQCKDPSRQYYLPSHPRDAASESTVHAGPLLDPATLPELPPAPRPPKMRRVRVSGDRRRGEARSEEHTS